MKLFPNSIKFIALAMALSTLGARAAAPEGYYSACENKSGTSLLSALYSTISSHKNVGYDGLWTVYETSDVRPNGTVWDMYSTKEWTVGKNQCGNYKSVGDCYNREHSFPKSWFNNKSPMNSDAFHIYPTDGKVNGQRSNFPYGECSGGTQVAANGSIKPLGKLGKCTYPGYSGTVFEPDDQYKGDFARSYFYMAARYYDQIANWSSDMLSGDKNSPFKPWAIEMLLKWHRQDPVSQKELTRNDAVYNSQHNRNPFIDHPELAEFIWGNQKGQAWKTGASLEPTIHRPQNGTEIALGITRPGVSITRKIDVHTSGAVNNVLVSVIGGGFSVSQKSIDAATANSGTQVTLTYNPSSTGSHAATLRVTNGTAVSSVTIRGSAVDGLPAGPVSDITDESFTAVWTYVGNADASGNYTLTVSDGQGTLDGYPKAVKATDGSYVVTGLMPSTKYTYTVANSEFVSEAIEVTTADPIPSIDFLFDGELAFRTAPGQPSEVAELVVETDNIDGSFSVTVAEPFQISLDKSAWETTLTLTPDENRLYMRLFSAVAGEFTTEITARYGDYVSDDATASGIAALESEFIENFDKTDKGSYTEEDYEGNACFWHFIDAGVWDSDPSTSGDHSVRLGKTTSSSIAMNSDIKTGIGTISFMARPFNTDGTAILAVETSTDGGNSYRMAGSVTVEGSEFRPYSVFAGVSGNARIRIRQTSGKRVNIDDVAISPYTSGCQFLESPYHAWDAFSADGQLIIEVSRETLPFAVYSLDGNTLLDSALSVGRHAFALVPGLYIVACGDDARTVVVR